MPRLLLALLLCMLPNALVHAADNELTESERRAGWRLLFDGDSTTGWRSYNQPAISDGWAVEEGSLHRAKPGAGDIVTEDEFDNFELSLEYRIARGGNSGIMFHVAEGDAPGWHTGPEIQVLDNAEGHDPQKSGWLYQLYSPGPAWGSNKPVDATRPAGEWNQVQVRICKTQCEINVNGIRYAEFQMGGQDWNDRVAKSKFKDFPMFGKTGRGRILLQDHGDDVAFRNIKIRPLTPEGGVPNPVDGELPVTVELAFPKLNWEGWSPVDDDGRPQPFRPILLTHAGDGSNRLFVPSQQGAIYVFPNDPNAEQATLFADLRDRVSYKDHENEEGLLGMAFHPRYQETGEFFVYYTSSKLPPHTSVISRFRVSKSDPQQADPAFEEELLRIPQPFWNHNGGTLAFGPDGYLYIGLGDGGAANDPYGNGQKLDTLLGKVLRIDIDHKSPGKAYAVPKDNPFVGQADAAPEVYALGFRNVWRMAFDRQTGALWAADVGQNLWEEINIVVKGGNYGWSLRESAHPFGSTSSDGRTDLIEPVWEYDHQVGKSITGGVVYRGTRIPELAGKYLYADYVSGLLWALHYDESARRVVSNESLRASEPMPIISFGEDESGEAYFTVVSATGQGIYRFAKAE